MIDVTCEWQIEASLGEGPLWVAAENAVYWVDIPQQHVHRLSLADGARQTWSFAVAVTSLSPRAQGGFVCTVRDGFAFLDLNTGTIEPIVLPEADLPGNRFNDGKVDGNGRYWAGTMDDRGELETGSLYRLDKDLSCHKMDENYIIDNGPTFSTDGKILYHTDSIKRTIYAFDLNETGDISNKRVFVQLPEEDGAPDGMTVDSENCIWLCHFGGSRITRYSPNGEILQVIPMPVPNITSCTFAGPELDTLYITTARLHMDEAALAKYPLAGSFFSCKPGVKGLPTTLFAG
ncbi:MAG: SMP-30/gluconolactonase/LRE family protein [Anaerolineae bacterium]|nr:SMP-30/gluconolactonase/LRE family protein [Anaerolineae bacterium]